MSRALLIFLLLGSQIVATQDYPPIQFKHLDLEDGLSQSSVIAINQDQEGFLWLATQDGLNRYDGYSFRYYEKYFWDVTNDSNLLLGKLYVDSSGILWIISETGQLEWYDEVSDSFQQLNQNLINTRCILENSAGSYLIGTENGLYQYQSSDQSVSRLLDIPIFHAHYHNGDAYFLSERKVLRLREGKIRALAMKDPDGKLGNSLLSAISNDEKGNIWLGTFGAGLFRLNRESEQFEKVELPELTSAKILSLLFDQNGRLWIGTYGEGVFLYDAISRETRQFTPDKNNPNAIAYSDILCLFKDNSNNIWLGTDGAGLNFYDENLQKFYGVKNTEMPEEIHVDVVRAIYLDKNGSLWLGTSGKGLTVQDSNSDTTWQTYTSDQVNLPSNRIMSLDGTSGNELWIGTQGGGLAIMNLDSREFSRPEEATLRNSTVWDLQIGQDNQAWLATRNLGLLQVDVLEKKIIAKHLLTQWNDANNNNIRCIENGEKEILWVGTEDDGIYKFDKTKEHFTSIDALREFKKIKCIYNDGRGKLWIGTNGQGLVEYDISAGTYRIYNKKDGLPNNVIYGILEDKANNLWFSSNRGICKMPRPNDRNAAVAPLIFDNYDGLQSFEFNTGAYFKDQDGILYFGGVNGVNWFNPNNLHSNPQVPKIMLTEVIVDNSSRLSELKQLGRLELKAKENDLSISFAASSFSIPERNQYRYQLKGFDETEKFSGNRNFVQYTNLPDGEYEFVAKASNYDNIWNEEGIAFRVVIATPWFRTKLAWFGYFILTSVLFLSIYYVLKRRWELQAELAQEQKHAQHLEEMSSFQNELYANITHEFRTPLTVITGMADEIQDAPLTKRLITDNANHLLQLINQILDLSKLERGFMDLHLKQDDIIPFLAYLNESFVHLADNKGIELVFKSVDDEIRMDFDREKLKEVYVNLLSNAIKFTPENGRVITEVRDNGKTLEIEVSDSGIGIPEKHIPFIFDRFYQVKSDDFENVGSGIGLAYSNELVKLMKGQIKVSSFMGVGSSFTIELPIEHQSPQEEFTIPDAFAPARAKEVVEPTSTTSLDHLDKARILIVEDNADVSLYLKTLLDKSYQVDTALNGEQGWENALTTIPELIISDVVMPRMSGYELCEKIKTNEITAHIPVILLTAKAEQADKLVGLDKGADAYLFKPFDKRELLIRIKQLLLLRNILQPTQELEKAKVETPIDPFLNKINAAIASNLDDEHFKTTQLCEAVFYSKMQVHRKLKALTGKSTSAYLKSYRLQKAQELLLKGENNISDVAFQTGFSSLQYFSSSFKKEYGVSPREYLKRRGK